MMRPMFIIKITIECVYKRNVCSKYVYKTGRRLFSFPLFSFAKWMKWPMGNRKQMVNDEQIMKGKRMMIASWVWTRTREKVVFDSIRSCWCSSCYFKDPADCSFFSLFKLHLHQTMSFLCQSSSLYRSNTQVIRVYNMSVHTYFVYVK